MSKRKTSTTKIRTNAVLLTLPEERQMEIYGLLQTSSAAVVRAELARQGVTTSETALYQFAAHWRLQLRFLQAQAQRDALAAQMLAKQAHVDPERLVSWGDLMFLTMAAADGNLDGYAKIRAVQERSRQTDADLRKLAMLEEKERKLREVEEALKKRQTAGGLSSETLEVIESTLGMILKQA